MSEQEEQEQRKDRLEVEISDLDEGDKRSHPPRLLSRLASLPFDLRYRHYRRPLTVVTVALIVLVVLLVINSTGATLLTNSGQGLNAQSTRQTSYSYVVQASPPWGHLLVDGHPARLNGIHEPQSIILSLGRHVLTWIAAPFTTQRCMLVVPPESGVDTCAHPVSAYPMNVENGVDSIIVFQASLGLLSPALRTALIQATQQSLDLQQSSDTVQPGEVYAISTLAFEAEGKPCSLAKDQIAAICYETARQALQATVSFQLDTDTTSGGPCSAGECSFNGEDCRLFCDAPAYYMPGTTPSHILWNTFAIAHILWQYRTLQGQPIVPVENDSFIWGQQDEHLVPLSITWDGHAWHATTSFNSAQTFQGSPMCDAANSDMSTLLFTDPHTNYEVDTIPAPTFALGCLLQVKQVTLPATPTPAVPAPVAEFLHRFGVLVAVNDAAHRLLPYVPLADAYERDLAQQLGG